MPIWHKVFNCQLFIGHARQATIGNPEINYNNHPFISDDCSLGLVHNGKIAEFDVLKNNFQIKSECDSEVLLRIIETSASKLDGIKELLSLTKQSHFAVAVAEKTRLWLFRNEHRSLWIVDLRKDLGQIFFCSTPEIWQSAKIKGLRYQRLFSLPTDEVWEFSLNEVRKFIVS